MPATNGWPPPMYRGQALKADICSQGRGPHTEREFQREHSGRNVCPEYYRFGRELEMAEGSTSETVRAQLHSLHVRCAHEERASQEQQETQGHTHKLSEKLAPGLLCFNKASDE